MKKWHKVIIGLVIFLIVGGVSYILWGPNAGLFKDPLPPTVSSLNQIHLVQEEKGRKVMEIFADVVNISTDGKKGQVKNLRVVFFQENGQKLEMTAPEGEMLDQGEKFILLPPIRGQMEDGSYFESQGPGTFTNSDKRIVLTGGVRAVQKDVTLTGDTLETTSEFRLVTVRGNQAKVIKGGSQR